MMVAVPRLVTRRRAPWLVAGLVAAAGAPLSAQNDSGRPPAQDARAARATVTEQLQLLQSTGGGRLPAADSFAIGGRRIPAGTVVAGPVGVANGTLEVAGRIDGNAIVVQGDLVVLPGGEVTGDAVTVGGRVSADRGIVGGEMRSIHSLLTPVAAAPAAGPAPPPSRWHAFKLIAAWFAVLVALGIGTMLFAERNMEGVVLTLERGVGRSFLAGFLGQVVALPALLVLIVALAITLVGILLIPFAIVAFALAMMGLVTMGFIAVAQLTGAFLLSAKGPRSYAETTRTLVAGVAAYLALWTAAAVSTPLPVAGTVLHGVALGVTWVAATVGLGATLLSRAGTGRAAPLSPVPSDPDALGWQTPTPVTGVSAGRRSATRVQ